MSKAIGLYSLAFSLLSFLFALTAAIWTEKDEAKRIAKIKSDEQRIYEAQMGEKLPELSSAEEAVPTAAEDEFFSPPKRHHSHGLLSHRHHFPSLSVPSVAAADHLSSNLSLRHSANISWCFHCASPWNVISEPMQRVVKNLLEIRRAHYPTAEMVRRDCVEPRVLDRLSRQICNGYSHCQTLILTDHDTGSAFTIRGCAERFGAVDAEVLAQRGDNVCKRLHEKVDIQECICERRKYCYAGAERFSAFRFTPMSEWHQQRAVPSSSSPGQNIWPSAEALERNGAAEGVKKWTNWETIGTTIIAMGMIRIIIMRQ